MPQSTTVVPIRKILVVLSCVLGTILTSLSARADDTEVFFSEVIGTTLTKSNILFVLDNSGSMGYDYSGNWAWGDDYRTPTLFPNRMSDLQSTMTSLLADVENVNIGLMTFTYECPGGAATCDTRNNYATLIHPITDIDLPGSRASIQNSVNAMLPQTNTPITASLFEAAMAMTGGRNGNTGGNYTNPILSECQQHHIVILSDGIANSDVPKAELEALIAPGLSCPAGDPTGEYCGVELAQWLSTTDHRPESGGSVNAIKVHTIGFAINSPYLENLAAAGDGGYKQASDGAELSTVFDEVLTVVKDVDTTFVNPVSSTDSLNRLSNSDDLYFGMFTPSLKARWNGNLKRYTLDLDTAGNVVIKDGSSPPRNAISPTTGYFADDARSIWSASADGADVTLGGAASKINYNTRRVFTHVGADVRPAGSSAPIDLAASSASRFDISNPSLNPSHFGVGSTAEMNQLISWARGADVLDEFEGSLSRFHMGDILHSSPISINYDHPNGPLIFVGTNEGFLHAIDSADGTEEYSFIPKELLGNLKLFLENSRDTPHPYGLDGSITYHHIDKASAASSPKDGDGLVNNGETAMIYFGMRRGGRNYYAMDVSSRSNPKLSWHIKGGTGDFAALGQSWSKPTPARIRYQGNVKNVLIFGGGYDENQDPTNERNLTQAQSTDSMGNAVYIVDASNGSLLWKADSGGYTDMKYSIPSDIRVVDIDADGLADRLYVGDMGAQLWRFDINSGHTSTEGANTLVYGGVMAKLGGSGIDNARRFYNKPDVALISKDGENFMSVSIGSGWRAHPRNSDVDDRFYMIRDNRPIEKITNSRDFGAVKSGTSWTPATESHLRDVTTSIDNQVSPDPEGWMLKFDQNTGEKSLSSSITINNQLVFSTYAPEESIDVCAPADDSSSLYAVDVLRGNPVMPLGASTTSTPTIDNRKEVVAVSGIPPSPTAVIKKNDDGTFSTGVLLGTRPVLPDLSFSELTRRTYWHDRLRGASIPGDIVEQVCGAVAVGSVSTDANCR